MTRYKKNLKIQPSKNCECLNSSDLQYHLKILQNPLHGRETGSNNSNHNTSGNKSINHNRRKYIKPYPIVGLTVSVKNGFGELFDITEYCLGYYFMKISLIQHSDSSDSFETDGLNNHSRISVGQLISVPGSDDDQLTEDYNNHKKVYLFQFTDLSIYSKGTYSLKFTLYQYQNQQIIELNYISSEPFEIYSGRKYYSEEKKQQRKIKEGDFIKKKKDTTFGDFLRLNYCNDRSFKTVKDLNKFEIRTIASLNNRLENYLISETKKSHKRSLSIQFEYFEEEDEDAEEDFKINKKQKFLTQSSLYYSESYLGIPYVESSNCSRSSSNSGMANVNALTSPCESANSLSFTNEVLSLEGVDSSRYFNDNEELMKYYNFNSNENNDGVNDCGFSDMELTFTLFNEDNNIISTNNIDNNNNHNTSTYKNDLETFMFNY